MSKWVLKGLKTGIKTTRYPGIEETAAGVTPGRPIRGEAVQDKTSAVSICPTGAITSDKEVYEIDYSRCIHCLRCLRNPDIVPVKWAGDYEWASAMNEKDSGIGRLKKPFQRSLHIRILDAGACGACLSEISQTGKPCYNVHRLGFFITPTPRTADVLMVAGPVTDHMRFALRETYEAMPEPRAVVAVGTCAMSGGVFGRSFASCGGASEVVPVDIAIPGCPPPPLAIIHGLLLLVGRKPSASLISHGSKQRRNAV